MKPSPKELFHEFLLMSLGTALVSVGVYFFKFPNSFSMGGVSGLAVLLGKLIPQLSPSTFNSIINLLFLLLGFLLLDRASAFARCTAPSCTPAWCRSLRSSGPSAPR